MNVILREYSSISFPLNDRVTQGSILGHTLFLTFIYEFLDISSSQVGIYSDESTNHTSLNGKWILKWPMLTSGRVTQRAFASKCIPMTWNTVIILNPFLGLLQEKLVPSARQYFCPEYIRYISIEYWCHIMASASVIYLEFLDKRQRRHCHANCSDESSTLVPRLYAFKI